MTSLSKEKYNLEDLTNLVKNYEIIVESISEGFVLFDRSYKYLLYNDTFSKIIRVDKKILEGKVMFDFYPDIKKTKFFTTYENVFNTGNIATILSDYIFDDGSQGWFENKVIPVPGEGEVEQIFVIIKDVTAEYKLKESEERYRDLYENAPNSYFSIDTNKIIRRCNNTAVKLLGYTKQELLNMKVFDLYYNSMDGIDKAKNIFQRFLNDEIIQDEELQMKKKNGTPIWISLTVNPIKDHDGKIIETHSMVIDISKRKKAELSLKESEKKALKLYKEANFYKDLFAHDINNILNGIKGASELYLLYEDDSTKLIEKHSLINIIKDQVVKGALLVSNVQKLSQLEDDKEIIFKEIDVREIMNKAKKYTRESFQERAINIDDYYFIEKPMALTNELLLDVFENILNNAVKYNDSPIANIQIKISREIENGKNYVKIEFINNGIGVMDEKKEIIFKKGYKKEKGTKGMGFGLTLVKKLIKSYNGKIWVEDNVKGDYTQGSNFVLIIPEVI